MKKVFKILAIDGGGIRGVFAAQVLKRIKEKLGKESFKEFDIISGTSTGAIVAAGLAVDYPLQELVNLYHTQGKMIFKQDYFRSLNLTNWKTFFKSKYNISYLKKVLVGMFGDTLLSQAKTNLIIPASDIISGRPFIFKAAHDHNFSLDNDIPLVDAVLASCAAPVFFNPMRIKGRLLTDGCLWANNPALAALMEAMSRNFNQPKESIRILSLGTGIGKKNYNLDDYPKNWGLGQWGVKLIGTIMSLQSNSVDNTVRFILDKDEQFLRINFEVDCNSALDDVGVVDDIIAYADEEFTANLEQIQRFFAEKN